MGHWGIEGRKLTPEEIGDSGEDGMMWSDSGADIVADYVERIATYDSQRLFDRERMIFDIGVLTWWVLEDIEEGRVYVRDELEYGLDFYGHGAFDANEVIDRYPASTDKSFTLDGWAENEDDFSEYREHLAAMDPAGLEPSEFRQRLRVLLEDLFVKNGWGWPDETAVDWVLERSK